MLRGGALTLTKYVDNPIIESGVFETSTEQIEIDAENRTYKKNGCKPERFTLTEPNLIHFFKEDVFQSSHSFTSTKEQLTIDDAVYTRVRIPEIGIYQVINSSPKVTIEITAIDKLNKTVTLQDGIEKSFTYEGEVLIIDSERYEKYKKENAATPLYDKNYSYYDKNGVLSFYTFKEDGTYNITENGTLIKSGKYGFEEPYLIQLGADEYIQFKTNDKLIINSKEYNINSSAHNIELEDKGIVLKPAYNNTVLQSYSIIGGNSTSVILTNNYNNLPITSIEKEAFKNRTNITSITFESSEFPYDFVIEESAFEGVDSLSSVNSGLVVLSIPEWVTEIKSRAFADTNIGEVNYTSTLIADDAFDGTPYILYPRDENFVYEYINESKELSVCSLIDKTLTSITIPNEISISGTAYKITAIGKNAFYGLDKIENVTLCENLKEIGDNAFAGTSITTITIPDSVTSFGVGVFENSKLETVNGKDIPWFAVVGTSYDKVKYLTDESGYIYERVDLNGKDFPSYKLSSVNNQNEVTVPVEFKNKSVTAVDVEALVSISKLTLAEDSSISALDLASLKKLEDLTLNKSVTNLDNIKLPSTIKTLDLSKTGITKLTTDSNYVALKGSLKTIILPKVLVEMEDNIFWNFQELTTVTFDMDSPIETIPISAFAQTTNLKNVNLPPKVTVLAKTSFAESGLTSLQRNGIPIDVSSDISAEYSTFYKTEYENTFLTDSTLKYEYVFDTTVMKVSRRASYEYTPDKTPTGIAVAGFVSDSAVKSEITIPATLVNGIDVTEISESAFENKSALTTVNFAEGSKIKSIKSKAFLGTGIKNIILPPSVGSVWADAFSQAAGDTITIIFNSEPVIEKEDDHPYYIYDDLFKYQVNFSADNKMESLILMGFKENIAKPNKLIIPSSYETNGLKITSINSGAFEADDTITSLSFAEGSIITEIPTNAFARTTALKTVDMGNIPSITIKDYAFNNSSIEDIVEASNIKYNNYAFNLCGKLATINGKTDSSFYLDLENTDMMEIWAFKGTLLEANYLLQDDDYRYIYAGAYPESCTYSIADYKHKESSVLDKQIVNIFASFRDRDITRIETSSFTSENVTLREVTFPNTSAIYVEQNAFSDNPNLVKVILSGQEKLENHAFYNCENLFDVIGYSYSMAVSGFPFEETPFLPNYENVFEFTSVDADTVSITGLVKDFGKTTLRIPAKVQLSDGEKMVVQIAEKAFVGNTTIEKVVIDDGRLEVLPVRAFDNTNIKSVVINDKDLFVASHAFANTANLESVVTSDGVTFSGNAFNSSKYESSVENGFKYQLLINDSRKITGYKAVYDSNSDVSQIKSSHFDSLPVTTISGDFTGVTSAQIEGLPESVVFIEKAFNGFTGTELIIPVSVKNIINSFDNSMNLTKVDVPASCLIDYNFEKHWNSESQESSFDKTPYKENLFLNHWYSVKDGKISLNNCSTKVPMAEGSSSLILPSTINGKEIKGIAANGFKNALNYSIELPNTYIAIEERAFEGNTIIESIVITNTECRFGNKAFANCVNLSDVIFPEEGLKHEIPEDAFSGTTYEKDFKNLALFDFYPYVMENSKMNIFDNKNAVSIKDPSGNVIDFDGYLVSAKPNNNNTDIIIPSAWRGKDVNGIMQEGFKGKVNLKTVTFEQMTGTSGSPLKYILSKAFSGCTNLEQLIVQGRLTFGAPRVIADAFEGTKNENVGFKYNGFYISFNSNSSSDEIETVAVKGSYLKDDNAYQVPSSVIAFPVTALTNTSGWDFPADTTLSFLATNIDIPANCFLNAANIVSVDFNNVKVLGANSFKGTSITSFKLDSGFTSIGTSAIPATVKEITVTKDAILPLKASYFANPATVTTIKTSQTTVDASLSQFTGVTELRLRDVTSIADGAFGSGLQSLSISNTETFTLTSDMMKNATNLQSVHLINIILEDNAFKNMANLETIDSSSDIVSIRSGALAGTSIKNFTGREGLISIAVGALPKTLERLELISSEKLDLKDLTSIFEASDTYALNYIRMPATITSFSANTITFAEFDNLKEVDITASSIGDGVLPKSLEVLNFGDATTITELTNKWFTPKSDGTYSLKKLELPASATSIADGAFEKFVNLTIDDFQFSKVQNIGSRALIGIKNTWLVLPKTVTTIGKDAFGSEIATLELDSTSITSVGDWLDDSSKLSYIKLPSTVTAIEDNAFADATENIQFKFKVDNGDYNSTGSIVSIGENAFKGTSIGSEGQYPLIIEESLESIGNSAFEGTCISQINLPGTLASVGANAFAKLDTDSTKKLTVGDGNIQLGSEIDGSMVGAFGGSKLSTVDFSANTKITEIEDYMFDGAILESEMFGYTELILNPAQTVLNTDAFSGSTADSTANLIVVGLDKLKTIGDGAFKNVCLFESKDDYNNNIIADFDTTGKVIGEGAFTNTVLDNLTIDVSDTSVIGTDIRAKSVVLSNGVNTIGANTFADNATNYMNRLESVVIPASVTNIGDKAFFGQESLSTVNIPNINVAISTVDAFDSSTEITTSINGNTIAMKYGKTGDIYLKNYSDAITIDLSNIPASLFNLSTASNITLAVLPANVKEIRLPNNYGIANTETIIGSSSALSDVVWGKTEKNNENLERLFAGSSFYEPSAVITENSEHIMLRRQVNASGEYYYMVTGPSDYSGTTLKIPERYNEIPITHIADNAFNSANKLTSVNAAYIDYFGHNAFAISKDNVIMKNGLVEGTHYFEDSFDSGLIENGIYQFIKSDDSSVEYYLIGVTNKVADSYTLPNYVIEGDTSATYAVAVEAFDGCINATTLVLPKSLYAYKGYYTKRGAFSGLTKLNKVEGITDEFNNGAFEGTPWFEFSEKGIRYERNNERDDSPYLAAGRAEDNTDTSLTFSYNLANGKICSGFTSDAFSNDTSLISVTIDPSIELPEWYTTFNGCSNLETVNYKYYYGEAFKGTKWYSENFYDDPSGSGLVYAKMDNNEWKVECTGGVSISGDSYTFLESVPNVEGSVITTLGSSLYMYLEQAKKITFPATIETVENGVLIEACKLEEIELLGDKPVFEGSFENVFANCKSYMQYKDDNSVYYLRYDFDAYTLFYCDKANLTEYEILNYINGVVVDSIRAFDYPSITRLTIPATIKTVDDGAFESLNNLESVIFLGDEQNITWGSGNNKESCFNSDCPYIVNTRPESEADLDSVKLRYVNNSYYEVSLIKAGKRAIVIPSTYKDVPVVSFASDLSFSGDKNDITSVDFGGIKAIPDNLFNGCFNLSSISGGNLTSIGSKAFMGCISLLNKLPADYIAPDAYSFSGVDTEFDAATTTPSAIISWSSDVDNSSSLYSFDSEFFKAYNTTFGYSGDISSSYVNVTNNEFDTIIEDTPLRSLGLITFREKNNGIKMADIVFGTSTKDGSEVAIVYMNGNFIGEAEVLQKSDFYKTLSTGVWNNSAASLSFILKGGISYIKTGDSYFFIDILSAIDETSNQLIFKNISLPYTYDAEKGSITVDDYGEFIKNNELSDYSSVAGIYLGQFNGHAAKLILTAEKTYSIDYFNADVSDVTNKTYSANYDATEFIFDGVKKQCQNSMGMLIWSSESSTEMMMKSDSLGSNDSIEGTWGAFEGYSGMVTTSITKDYLIKTSLQGATSSISSVDHLTIEKSNGTYIINGKAYQIIENGKGLYDVEKDFIYFAMMGSRMNGTLFIVSSQNPNVLIGSIEIKNGIGYLTNADGEFIIPAYGLSGSSEGVYISEVVNNKGDIIAYNDIVKDVYVTKQEDPSFIGSGERVIQYNDYAVYIDGNFKVLSVTCGGVDLPQVDDGLYTIYTYTAEDTTAGLILVTYGDSKFIFTLTQKSSGVDRVYNYNTIASPEKIEVLPYFKNMTSAEETYYWTVGDKLFATTEAPDYEHTGVYEVENKPVFKSALDGYLYYDGTSYYGFSSSEFGKVKYSGKWEMVDSPDNSITLDNSTSRFIMTSKDNSEQLSMEGYYACYGSTVHLFLDDLSYESFKVTSIDSDELITLSMNGSDGLKFKKVTS